MRNIRSGLLAVLLGELCPLISAAENPSVDELVRDLKSETFRDRFRAATELKKLGAGAKDALPALIVALNDPENSVRQLAAQSIGNLGVDGKPALPTILDNLQKSQSFLAIDYATAITRISDTASKTAVRRLLVIKSPKTGRMIIKYGFLDEFPNRTVKHVVELVNDESVEVRASSAKFLGRLATWRINNEPIWKTVTTPSSQNQRVLLPMLKDAHSSVRIQAGIAFAKLSREQAQPAVPAIIEGVTASQIQGYEAANLVGHIPKDAVPQLVNALASKPDIQHELIAAITVWPDLAAPQFIVALKHEKAGVRYGAAHGLAHHRLKPHRAEADAALALALTDSSVDVRLRAAELLVDVNAQQIEAAVPVLVAVLGDDAVPRRRRAAAALGHAGPTAAAAIEPLIRLLDHSDETFRVYSAVAITQIDTGHLPAARPVFEQTILAESQPPHTLKERVLTAAITMGTKADALVGCLTYACKRPVPNTNTLQLLLARALVAVATDQAQPGIDNVVRMLSEGNWSAQTAAIRTLGEIGPPTVSAAPQLLRLVDAEKHKTATRAAIALLRIRPSDIKARGYLSDSLALGVLPGRLPGKKRQRFYTCIVAFRTGDRVTSMFVPELVAVLANPDSRYTSRMQSLIGRLEGAAADTAVPALRKLLEHDSEKVREAASTVLERLDAEATSS